MADVSAEEVAALASALPAQAAVQTRAKQRKSSRIPQPGEARAADLGSELGWFRCRVESTELLARGVAEVEPTRLVLRFDWPNGHGYRLGQCLDVLPQNDVDTVRGTLRRLGLRGAEPVPTSAGSRPLWQHLLEERDLARASAPMRELLRECAGVGDASGKLWRVLTRAGGEPSVFELLETLSESPPTGAFLGCLERLQPRTYALSSTPSEDPSRGELLVWPVVSASQGRERRGLASDYLCRVVRPGDSLRVRLSTRPPPSLPVDSRRPLVFLCAGTAIALVRAFLRELELRPQRPETWLFLDGDGKARPLGFEAACQSELQAWREGAVLHRYGRCVPPRRSQFPPLVGQLRKHPRRLERLLAQNATFYLLGQLGSQKEEVLAFLSEALQRAENLTAADAAQEMAGWRESGRLQECPYAQ